MRQQLKRLENSAHCDDRRLTMKSQLIAIIAAVLLVGCATTQSPEPPTTKVPDTSIHDAVFLENIGAIKQHLAAGTDVNAKGYRGRTSLHWAALTGRKEIVDLLIDRGADVKVKDDKDLTPLHYAAGKGHKEIAEWLIAEGADVNAKDDNGTTPLDRATMPNSPFNTTETANLLRQHGGKTGEELKAVGK